MMRCRPRHYVCCSRSCRAAIQAFVCLASRRCQQTQVPQCLAILGLGILGQEIFNDLDQLIPTVCEFALLPNINRQSASRRLIAAADGQTRFEAYTSC